MTLFLDEYGEFRQMKRVGPFVLARDKTWESRFAHWRRRNPLAFRHPIRWLRWRQIRGFRHPFAPPPPNLIDLGTYMSGQIIKALFRSDFRLDLPWEVTELEAQ